MYKIGTKYGLLSWNFIFVLLYKDEHGRFFGNKYVFVYWLKRQLEKNISKICVNSKYLDYTVYFCLEF